MNEVSFTSKLWGTDAEAGAPDEVPATDMHDAAEFQRWMQTGSSARSTPDESASSPLGEMLHSVSRSLSNEEEEFNKSLKRAARTSDPMDGLAVQKHLSELYLRHGLAVKVIAKTTQGVETLMRMQ